MPARSAQKTTKRRRTGWKQTASLKKRKTQVRKKMIRYTLVAVLFVMSFLSLFTYFTYKKMTQPFVSASSNSSYSMVTEDNFAISFILVDDLNAQPILIKSTHVMFFDVKNKKVLQYKFDGDLDLDIAGKYSFEPLSKILGLGMMLNDDDFEEGLLLTNQTLENFFAASINKYVIVDNKLEKDFNDFLSGNNKAVLNLDFFNNIRYSMRTDMNFNEAQYVYKFLSSVGDDRITKTTVTNKHVQGREVIDTMLQEMTYDSKIAAERKSVAVLNGARVPGLASFGSRVVKNMGGRVIAVGNTNLVYEKSIVVADDITSETAKNMIRFFDVDTVIDKRQATHLFESEITRADVTVIVGIDISESL
jgi:hypothetical protein